MKNKSYINTQGLDTKEKEVPKIKINSASTPTEQRTPLTAHVLIKVCILSIIWC